MTNVISLQPDGILPNEPLQSLVETLEDMLERARSGDLRGMAWVEWNAQDLLTRHWDYAPGGAFPISAGISMLAMEHTQYLSDDGDE